MKNKSNCKYRHEYKYLLSNAQITILIKKIEKIMKRDSHSINGAYNISSIYFDDYDDRCFFETENGLDPRQKMRIRIYNHSDNYISLECKEKQNGMTFKIQDEISKEEACRFIKGLSIPTDPNRSVVNKLVMNMKQNRMHPVVIVEYDRIPFVYKEGNVRITFDTNLVSSSRIDLFFENNYPKRPVMPKGLNLMEVKFDEFLPDVIYNTLLDQGLTRTNYSKYYLCRKFTI